MSDKKKGPNKGKKKAFHSRVKGTVRAEKFSPSSPERGEIKKLSTRTVRHYQPETVNIIKNSLNIISPKIDETEPEKKNDSDYVSAVTAIKTALSQLADTLTNILTEDPDESDKTNHRDLLANYFQMPGTDSNGIHLVATSNIEALSEDLNLHKNTREYNWLMNNGVNVLECEILTRISSEMTQLESGQPAAVDYQHERTIELQEIAEKTKL